MVFTKADKKIFDKALIDLESTRKKIAEDFGVSQKSITRILANEAGNIPGNSVHDAKSYIVKIIKNYKKRNPKAA